MARQTRVRRVRNCMVVTVVEAHEIAGELWKEDVVVFQGRLLSAALEYALNRWGLNPPRGAKIKDVNTGDIYDIPCRREVAL
jgi:hypothetical protein